MGKGGKGKGGASRASAADLGAVTEDYGGEKNLQVAASHPGNNESPGYEERKKKGTIFGERIMKSSEQREEAEMCRKAYEEYLTQLEVFEDEYNSLFKNFIAEFVGSPTGAPDWIKEEDEKLDAAYKEYLEKKPLVRVKFESHLKAYSRVRWAHPPMNVLRTINGEKAEHQAIALDIHDRMRRMITEMDIKMPQKKRRVLQLTPLHIFSEKKWGNLGNTMKEIFASFRHPYFLVTEVQELRVSDKSLVRINWLRSSTITDYVRQGEGNATTGYFINMLFSEARDDSSYMEQILAMALDYEVALLNYFNFVAKSKDPMPHKVGIPILPLISESIPGDLEADLNIACLAIALNRIPTPLFPFQIVLYVPKGRSALLYRDKMELKQEQMRQVSNFTFQRDLASAKFGRFGWIRNGTEDFDRLQRMKISMDSINAAAAGGYRLADGKVREIKHVPHMIKHTFIQSYSDRERYSINNTFATRMLLLPGEVLVGRNAADIATMFSIHGKKCVIVNAASGYNCGGGSVWGGRHALEETLCAETTLFLSLNAATSKGIKNPKSIYEILMVARRTHLHIPEFGAVVSPCVEMFRRSIFEGYRFEEYVTPIQGIVSIAAYNKNSKMADCPVDAPHSSTAFIEGMKKKFHAAVTGAIRLRAEVLIVPSIGTGVYMGNPSHIAQALGSVLAETAGSFKFVVIFGDSKSCEKVAKLSKISSKLIFGRHKRGEAFSSAKSLVDKLSQFNDQQTNLKLPQYLESDLSRLEPKPGKLINNLFGYNGDTPGETPPPTSSSSSSPSPTPNKSEGKKRNSLVEVVLEPLVLDKPPKQSQFTRTPSTTLSANVTPSVGTFLGDEEDA